MQYYCSREYITFLIAIATNKFISDGARGLKSRSGYFK